MTTKGRGSPEFLLSIAVSIIGAVLAATAYITMIWLEAQSSVHDMARGEPLWITLTNPFVVTVAAPVVALSSLLAIPVVYLALRNTVVWLSVLTLYGLVLAEIVVVSLSDSMLALYASYPTLVAAAILCRVGFRRRSRESKAS